MGQVNVFTLITFLALVFAYSVFIHPTSTYFHISILAVLRVQCSLFIPSISSLFCFYVTFISAAAVHLPYSAAIISLVTHSFCCSFFHVASPIFLPVLVVTFPVALLQIFRSNLSLVLPFHSTRRPKSLQEMSRITLTHIRLTRILYFLSYAHRKFT